MSGIDLDAIRERWESAKLTDLDDGASHYRRITAANRSAQDIPGLLAEVERLAAVNNALAAAKGDGWRDGYEAGCSTSHSLGCDSVAAERDSLGRQLEEARQEIGRLRAERDL